MELMDDLSIGDERLERALYDLRGVNRWLGGYATVREGIMACSSGSPHVRVLDLGSGLADVPAHLVRWGDARGLHIEVDALDANAATVEYARLYLDRHMPARLRSRVTMHYGDALDPPFERKSFDVVTAALFVHHFQDEAAVELLRVMGRMARRGIVVSDLHRHPLAYYGILLISRLLDVSSMFAHDGPVSVRRGFLRHELKHLARTAGLRHVQVGWRWAFRWLLTARPPGC